jgi:hypothetical protein
MTKGEGSKSLLIPDELYRLVEERAKSTGFDSVEEYIIFILQEVVNDANENEVSKLGEEDEEEVRKRLKALGYLE